MTTHLEHGRPGAGLATDFSGADLRGLAPAVPAASDRTMVRLNVGCGSTAPAEWINIDNSPTIWLARRPLAWRLGRLLRLIPADMENAPAWAQSIVVANALRGLPFETGSVDA